MMRHPHSDFGCNVFPLFTLRIFDDNNFSGGTDGGKMIPLQVKKNKN